MVPDLEVGGKIAEKLVEERVAACVNLIGNATSCYRWMGKICVESEAMLLAKTRDDLVERVRAVIEQDHPYELPEVIVLPISGGSDRYLEWVRAETQ